jgi:hypothetical protein
MPHAVLLVHGIGDNPPGWADAIISRLRKRIRGAVAELSIKATDPDAIALIEPATWSQATQRRQRVLSEILRNAPDLLELRSAWPWDLWKRFVAWYRRRERAFVAEFVGDVIGYHESEAAQGIRQSLMEGLQNLARRASAVPISGKIPLTIIAHSLGSVIASDFIWDQQQLRASSGQAGFDERFQLFNLFTIGSPLALFSRRYGGPEAFNQPIVMEHPAGRWVNIYDRDDPFAMPLKPLNSAYDRAVLKDARVQAGLYLFSHQGYFEHNDTLDIVARKVTLDWASAASRKSTESLAKISQRFDQELAVA